jgi:large subunit ribosomal protein L17
MQHQKQNRTLSRNRSQRTALLRGLAISLFREGKIETTVAKAKELRPFAERLISYGKKNTVASRRQAASALGEPRPAVIKNIFDEVAPRYAERAGGYTRIVKMGRTPSGRDMAVIELV